MNEALKLNPRQVEKIEEILYREDSVIAPEDVESLMEILRSEMGVV